ncbi:ABC transporter permease [Brucella pituitosa]|nr:ABC transporter permease [Brucella pituitosa]PQZ50159.1 ABC transporter permease [Ochrobactrum sp. MYb19]PRA55126.1 ABC transporter permease [Ochrobactrum sp. MYb68]PRA68201.1 ABC transporter permease [Ochrobactrum sp. MYb18]PRA74572.1 ABC transporter permease [Brucella thiophenivorans]PRA84508.1 ABC transporter permease [Ochrobactrum sp. MYb29]PRA90451.1 ABC transporter permease [Ochrobactrum sp. MYb14]PRA95902.1 ABC transporter permease [Ochrobactrum sp. MYb15]
MDETVTEVVETPKKNFNAGALLNRYGTVAILIAVLIVAASLSNVFLTERNIMNVLRQVAGPSLMAVGMLFVILTRGIDLSVGSVAALGSVLSAILIQQYGTGMAIGGVLLAGAACGLVSGILVAYLKLPPFVTTLAVMTIARGLAFIFSSGQPIMMGEAGSAVTAFGSGTLGSIPYPVILMIVVFVIAGAVLTFTRFGRLVKAIGSNSEAVRLSGISVSYYTLSVYVISGVLAAAAGIISTSRTGIGSANISVGAELDAIAAVVIGGASLMGGRGGAFNTFIGVIILGIIANMMNLARVPGYHQQVFMGCIIIGAMLLQYASSWLRKS